MSINVTTEAHLDFAALQARIHQQEQHVVIRLTSLVGKEEDGVTFNAHVYESVEDNEQPYSKLFGNSGAGGAASDPVIAAWLASHPGQRIVYEDSVYISSSPAHIAVVR
jgi:hypothetical protein